MQAAALRQEEQLAVQLEAAFFYFFSIFFPPPQMQAAALRQEEQLAAQLEAQRRRREGRAEKEREREREREVERGTQFFYLLYWYKSANTAYVSIRQHTSRGRLEYERIWRCHFTCFTGTKVPILTQKALLARERE